MSGHPDPGDEELPRRHGRSGRPAATEMPVIGGHQDPMRDGLPRRDVGADWDGAAPAFGAGVDRGAMRPGNAASTGCGARPGSTSQPDGAIRSDGAAPSGGGSTVGGAAVGAGNSFGTGIDPGLAFLPAVRAELADLRMRVPGVRGCALGGIDGLLLTHDLPPGPAPHDLVVLAATTFGLGRQAAIVLGQSPFRDATLRSEGGYFTVYAVGDRALLCVLGDDGINVARPHLEARPAAVRLAAALRSSHSG